MQNREDMYILTIGKMCIQKHYSGYIYIDRERGERERREREFFGQHIRIETINAVEVAQ